MKRYDVIVGGNRTTLLLSDEDARKRGLLGADKPAAPAEAAAPVKAAPAKAKTPANKARQASTKRAAAAAEAFTAKGD